MLRNEMSPTIAGTALAAASRLTLLCVVLAAAPLLAKADEPVSACGPLRAYGQYGPYDFRKDLDRLPIVLGAHFTPEVEALIRGRTSTTPGADIDYTLRAIPNHHRALLSMMRLGDKERSPKVIGATYTVECYFDRGIRFAPDDQIVRMLYATYLTEHRRNKEALAQLQAVQTMAGDSPFTHYNLGLLFFELKEYDLALAEAHQAMALGHPQPGLRDKLHGVGRWTEPPAAPAAPAAVSAASAPAADKP
jgi:tetratricopeptide (TPR) repeat protein